ncbi:solute carrier family 52, riboflavin transporter, member 3-A-like [Episyrphus balteatus]|uniref:solute carrier family 52, riboflavin transporter, member 3-A-like n=1 Tax=Episyrphus balteatus TaxID=286459 RepID=UPI00248624FD|nr:solute carrier family 52, riboflavin transporter, member 3-A-like [Episyrphus balteatus]XP_055853382.1 solute carrier family 52, riboflavin transporter, member 3-A-like [Episyrphus balteatus]XP_055853383.1 solute carrier family 52, riboflavin transporter, member 3-A-like [Episyrphus balteatus]XP_055853384.1 solute carrier family 52, riboflavin transporter, member 3-A-like [Episyrphus balteatus]XP_055853385.1 solute carrier family 52, riboflavin transporter, member 3-A-like [Episyrphus baltea
MNTNDGDGEPEIGQDNTVHIIPHDQAFSSEVDYRGSPADSDTPDESRSLLHPNMRERLLRYRDRIKDRNLIVDLLALTFAVGTWLCVNGTFLQLPLLVDTAPESWSLPSYLSIVVQLGNFGPLMYTIVQKISHDNINESIAIYTFKIAGTISAILAAFFYDRTAVIGGKEYSVALYIFMFLFAVTACTSSVLFMPYMGRFKEIYLITYLCGEGVSGLLPSIVALIQGVGGSSECVLHQTEEGPVWEKYTTPPLFGTRVFYIICFGLMICSCIGFLLLDRLKLAKKEYANVTVTTGNKYTYKKDNGSSKVVEKLVEISSFQYKCTLLLMGLISFFANGMFSSIQSYSTMPYGNEAYHLTATLSLIANPIACFSAAFLPHTSLKAILSLTSIAVVCSIYVFVTAFMSPNPFLVDSSWGSTLVVTIWTVLIGIVSFVKVCITTVMRAQGGKSLVWTGAVSLTGSAVGSVLIFVLINCTSIFKSYDETCG